MLEAEKPITVWLRLAGAGCVRNGDAGYHEHRQGVGGRRIQQAGATGLIDITELHRTPLKQPRPPDVWWPRDLPPGPFRNSVRQVRVCLQHIGRTLETQQPEFSRRCDDQEPVVALQCHDGRPQTLSRRRLWDNDRTNLPARPSGAADRLGRVLPCDNVTTDIPCFSSTSQSCGSTARSGRPPFRPGPGSRPA